MDEVDTMLRTYLVTISLSLEQTSELTEQGSSTALVDAGVVKKSFLHDSYQSSHRLCWTC